MTESLVDTDILSFYFKGDTKVVESFREYLRVFEVINLSIITYYEILGGLKAKNAVKQIEEFETFVGNKAIIHISQDSANLSSNVYADLRKRGITIGASDILIAGISLVNDLTLVTNNERHYDPIRGLRIENWTK